MVTLTVTDDLGLRAAKTKTITGLANYQVAAGNYNWVDRGALSPLLLNCDVVSSPQTLPFEFNFYGCSHDQVYAGANGLLGFAGESFFDPNTNMPCPDPPNDIICPFWADLDLCASGNIYLGTIGSPPERKFVVSWESVPDSFNPNALFTFQLWLEETTHCIQFQYQQVQPASPSLLVSGGKATIGLEDATGSVATRISYNGTAPVTNGQAIRFRPPPVGRLDVAPASGSSFSGTVGGPFSPATAVYVISNSNPGPLHWSAAISNEWLRISPLDGWLMDGQATNVLVSISESSGSLAPGNYAGSLLFRHFGNDTAQMTRSVALYILPPAGNLLVLPDVALTAAGPTSGPFRPASFEFTLINAGGSSLFWTANINPDSDWLDLSSADGNLAPLGTNVITIQPNAKAAKLGVGTNATQITFVNVSNLQNSVTRQFVLEIYPFSFAASTLAISSGDFTASLHGVPGWSYVIESSTNLSDWTRLITNTASTVNGSLSFTDPKAGDLDRRFYRARSFP